MTRYLKDLSFALAAACVFSAVLASGASAQMYQLTAPEPVTLKGEETGGAGSNALTVFGGKTECPGSTLTGHKIASTPHILIPSGATEITLNFHPNNCTTTDVSGSKFATTIDMNGCDYKGKIGGTTEGATSEAVGFDIQIICPPGTHIQATLFSSGTHALRICTLTITNTVITSDGHIGNDGGTPHRLWIAGTYTNIRVHKSGLCGSATDEAGNMHLDLTVKGFEAETNQTDITITD